LSSKTDSGSLTISPDVMVSKEYDSLTTTNHSVLEKTFAVNTYGPLLLTQALLPNILKASSPKIGNMVSSGNDGTALELSDAYAVFPSWLNS
jgi:short-subunit dehydrogenase